MILASASEWDGQYRAGTWDYLAAIEQAARYGVLASWLRNLSAPLSILDIGCGEGIMLRYLFPGTASHYLGIDHSKVAIARAQAIWSRQGVYRFEVGAAESVSDRQLQVFDVVILNEVLYCLDEPLEIVRRALANDCVVLFSVTGLHPETIRLLTRGVSDAVIELVECADKERSKTWTLGMLRAPTSPRSG